MYLIIGKKKTAASKLSKEGKRSSGSSSSSGEDKGRVSARAKLGEVDVPEIVNAVVQSSKQVLGADISEAGCVLEFYRVARLLGVYILIFII
jgi:hypothetical protein